MAEPESAQQVALGSNIAQADRGGTAVVNVGWTPEALQQLGLMVIERTRDAAREAELAALGRQLDVSQDALVGFFHILDVNAVPPEKLPQTLAEIAQRHREMLQRLGSLDPEDPAIRAIIDKARGVIDRADSEVAYDQADRLLGEAEALDLAAIHRAELLAQEAQAAANRRRLNAASTRVERGELSLTRLDYLQGAQHFKAAADQVPDEDGVLRAKYLKRYADALFRHGDENGDNTALLQAIGVYHQALDTLPRGRVPLDWATQNNLGNALSMLGEREPGTARLEEAVAAYRAALTECARERVPLNWAMTQNNLATALARLGQRAPGTARLEEAVAAYRAALTERTPERVPLEWAMTQTNLGTTLWKLGERESGTARLEEAVAAYRAALTECTREGSVAIRISNEAPPQTDEWYW